jgi:hypothetical protein
MLSGARPNLRAHVSDTIRLIAFDKRQAKRCLYGDDEPADCVKLFRTPRLSVRVVGIARTASDVNNRGTDISVSLLGGRFFERYRSSIAWTPGLAVRLRPGVTPESFVDAVHRAVPAGAIAELDLRNANATFDAVGVLTTGLWLFALVAGLASGVRGGPGGRAPGAIERRRARRARGAERVPPGAAGGRPRAGPRRHALGACAAVLAACRVGIDADRVRAPR